MVWYTDLRNERLFTPAERDWTSRRLLDLRAHIAAPPPRGIPRRTKDASLIIGTWNIRDFDNNKFRHGPRRRESLHYIAEILSSFDVCALQEVNEDLGPLKDVIRLMGPGWDFIATDITTGPSGNRERMAYIYDSRKVRFRNIAGEIVLPKHALLPGEEQFARTPFLVSFQAGWFKFSLCTVHIYFGETSKNSDGYQRRVQEIDYLAREMAGRADREDENYILLGDFNIKNPIDETMQALTKAGFQLPPELFPSNLLGTHYYDQIAFRTRKDELTFLSAGAFNWAETVFKPEHYDHYAPALPARHRDLGADGQP
ncbi:MAG: endonuclease/exonuclease/phosphatase family protein, partial [Hyphomonas sp.]|nr:endonuclease/exonuclease/phosphatase family protein [Hyphomonas sp.]